MDGLDSSKKVPACFEQIQKRSETALHKTLVCLDLVFLKHLLRPKIQTWIWDLGFGFQTIGAGSRKAVSRRIRI